MSRILPDRVAVYVRVSTGRQETENQERDLRQYCKRNGCKIYKLYDDVVSGSENHRPAFDRMFRDAHKLLFNTVLFWDVSRFSRSGTLFTLQKFRELENLGIRWKSYNEPNIDSAGQFSDIVISIMATLAKIEREKISERTKAGLRRTVGNGTTLGRPKIPPHIIEQVMALRRQGYSHNKIHKEMRDVMFRMGAKMRTGLGLSTISRLCKETDTSKRGPPKSG